MNLVDALREAFLAGLSIGETGDIANYENWDAAADEYVSRNPPLDAEQIVETSITMRLAELAVPAGQSIAELSETAPVLQARTHAALTRWRGAVDAAISAGVAPHEAPGSPGLWLVVITDKDAAGEPDVGFAIAVGSRDEAGRVGVAMETALCAAGQCRCVHRLREVELGRHYRASAMVNTGRTNGRGAPE